MNPFILGISVLICSFLQAQTEVVPLADKSRFGLGYDLELKPEFGRFIGEGHDSLKGLHRGFLSVEFPLNHYWLAGVALDYTGIISKKNKNPNLSISRDSSRLISHFLGASGKVSPQWPITFNNLDLILYGEFQAGIGTSSPIFFGTQPLSNYAYNDTSNIPSPFPLYLETSSKLGLQLFSWRFFGIDLAYGYRVLWIVHPMVSIEEKNIKPNMIKDSRSAVWYDVSYMFLELGIKCAF